MNGPQGHNDTEMNGSQSHRDTELSDLNALTARIIGCAIAVHRAMGPGSSARFLYSKRSF